jgi:hypothetical protein
MAAVDRGYVKSNDVERARLKAFVAKASDSELARSMPAGWTVSGVLAHLAFWDQRILALLDQWETKNIIPRIEIAGDVDWINDAAKPMFMALAPRRAAELVVQIAEAVDRRVAALSDDAITRNVAAGSPLNLVRAIHRKEHLDEIEHALKA